MRCCNLYGPALILSNAYDFEDFIRLVSSADYKLEDSDAIHLYRMLVALLMIGSATRPKVLRIA